MLARDEQYPWVILLLYSQSALRRRLGPEDRFGDFGSIALNDPLGNSVGAADLAEHAGAAAWDALLRPGVDLDEAKARLPAIIPLEIVYQRPVEVPTDRNAIAQRAMDRCQVLQNRTRAAIIERIVKAVLGDVERPVAARALIDGFQDAVEALGIDLAKAVIQPDIVMHHPRLHEAAAKKFRRGAGIEAHQLARIVVHAMIVSCPCRSAKRRHHHIERKGKAAAFAGLQQGPTEIGIVDARNRAIERRECIGRIKETIVRAVANLGLRLDPANSIECLDVRLHQVAQYAKSA